MWLERGFNLWFLNILSTRRLVESSGWVRLKFIKLEGGWFEERGSQGVYKALVIVRGIEFLSLKNFLKYFLIVILWVILILYL